MDILRECARIAYGNSFVQDVSDKCSGAYSNGTTYASSLNRCLAYWEQAYYSQNFGSPCLEYMLCHNALALALGKGLHRKPTPGWNLTTNERSHRNCLFWALYCLEKQIEKQSGRPSVSMRI